MNVSFNESVQAIICRLLRKVAWGHVAIGDIYLKAGEAPHVVIMAFGVRRTFG